MSIGTVNAFKAILFYCIIKYNDFAMRMAFITEKTLPSFLNLIVLMFFIIVIYAYVGLGLFVGRFPQNTIPG